MGGWRGGEGTDLLETEVCTWVHLLRTRLRLWMEQEGGWSDGGGRASDSLERELEVCSCAGWVEHVACWGPRLRRRDSLEDRTWELADSISTLNEELRGSRPEYKKPVIRGLGARLAPASPRTQTSAGNEQSILQLGCMLAVFAEDYNLPTIRDTAK